MWRASGTLKKASNPMRTIANDFVDALARALKGESVPEPESHNLMTNKEQRYMWEQLNKAISTRTQWLEKWETKAFCGDMRLALNHFITIVEERGIPDDNTDRGTERSGKDDCDEGVDKGDSASRKGEVYPLPDSEPTT